MLLKANTRQIFVDLGYESKACNKLKNDSRDDEFLVSRIIFLTTYESNIDIQKLIDHYHLAENICVNISRHAKQYVTKQKKVKELDPMEDLALVESLKLMFNLSHFCPQRNGSFSPILPSLLTLLTKKPVSSSKPLDAPIGTLVNALINLDFDQKENVQTLFPKTAPNVNVDRFIEILDKSTKVYTDSDLEHLVSPLLTLIRKLYEIAPRDVQLHMQQLLLPSNQDRQQPLGRAESLSSRLLRQSTNPGTPQVRESVSSLLFELSGKDAKSFVQNVGYGFASGFLFQHNVPIPENALEAWSTSGSESSHTRASHESYKPVNPITGQTLESEPVIEEPEMTQEEKEREAEKLFVLFERLKKTGVMSVKNPVETAFSEGRFLELDDDADSE
ncbi:Synembryn [Hyphodiscus hymeniophilus]|uniref:Synembryn n=1 Tax=Hyphodiscus hymeniophilus TaxID=353542 RepID=A0A9P6SKN0_9HELO|nr:Synembryn [Hyphodiscus hymeniophilus]